VLMLLLSAGRGGEGEKNHSAPNPGPAGGLGFLAVLMLRRRIRWPPRRSASSSPRWKASKLFFEVSPLIRRPCRCLWKGSHGDGWRTLAGPGGEGSLQSEASIPSSSRWRVWFWMHPEENYMATLSVVVIYGRLGGFSSTSMAEALLRSLRRRSTPRRLQVVRPRRWQGGRRQRSTVGMEIQASELFSDLGFALRSPADGGERILGPDCFFTLRSRVLLLFVLGFFL
jgi:hypothetical protein